MRTFNLFYTPLFLLGLLLINSTLYAAEGDECFEGRDGSLPRSYNSYNLASSAIPDAQDKSQRWYHSFVESHFVFKNVEVKNAFINHLVKKDPFTEHKKSFITQFLTTVLASKHPSLMRGVALEEKIKSSGGRERLIFRAIIRAIKRVHLENRIECPEEEPQKLLNRHKNMGSSWLSQVQNAFSLLNVLNENSGRLFLEHVYAGNCHAQFTNDIDNNEPSTHILQGEKWGFLSKISKDFLGNASKESIEFLLGMLPPECLTPVIHTTIENKFFHRTYVFYTAHAVLGKIIGELSCIKPECYKRLLGNSLLFQEELIATIQNLNIQLQTTQFAELDRASNRAAHEFLVQYVKEDDKISLGGWDWSLANRIFLVSHFKI